MLMCKRSPGHLQPIVLGWLQQSRNVPAHESHLVPTYATRHRPFSMSHFIQVHPPVRCWLCSRGGCTTGTPGVQASLDESSMENIPVDVNSLRQPQGMAVDIGANMRTPQSKPEEVGCPPPSSMLRRLDALQIFCACLYTQDLVPEDFIHKILDSHRFSSLSWPGPARHVGLMSACDMMMFCGKRLEKLGSLCHVMPDWYSYLRSLQQDLSIPRAVHDRIATVVGLRENGWISETSVSA
eukprot:jgi/Ulvmu1/1497/UM011_0227.1